MCGIVGEAGNWKYTSPGDSTVAKMADTLVHRGPDDQGVQTISGRDWRVNMAMRRLAIIDREHGQQPFHAGRASVMFNGEIYNHKRLRKHFGLMCNTDCDGEVIARLYDMIGLECIKHLEGMFTIAIWDRKERRLHLVRDRMGKKPLYYYWDQGRNLIVWGSEIKAILAHPSISKELNREAIYHYLSLQYVPEPMTAYEGVMAVPGGSILTYDYQVPFANLSKYWELGTNRVEVPGRETMLQQIRGTVRNAVHDRLESEVPLGVYLSGGIDSSIVTMLAKEQIEDLHTFTMGFEENEFNELPAARQTARYFGTQHHEEVVKVPCLPEMADRIVDQYDQPFGDCSAIPTMLMAESSKKYITVALTGDGGDEAFGGYTRYWTAQQTAGLPGYLGYLCVFPFPARDQLISLEFRNHLTCEHTGALLMDHAIRFRGNGLRNNYMWVDTHSYLPNDIIVKMERASMAASVEARCPFLDHRVFELAFSIEDEDKIEGDQGKLVLKDAFKSQLPVQVLSRPKQGFGVPISEWFRAEHGQQLLAHMVSDLNWPWGIFEPKFCSQIIHNHLRGTLNIGHALWVLLMAHLWLKKHFG